MADRYAPALLLDVLAFWFVLRWLLSPRAILLVGRLLVMMMIVGALGTLGQHHYVWAAFFVASAALAWGLLRRWRHPRVHRTARQRNAPSWPAWRGVEPVELATLCERRLGLKVDAAVPARIAGDADHDRVLALAGNGLWVLDDESRLGHRRMGRVVACWARRGLVANVEHARRRELLELSWPGQGALVRATTRSGQLADAFVGHLVADELLRRAS